MSCECYKIGGRFIEEDPALFTALMLSARMRKARIELDHWSLGWRRLSVNCLS